MHKCTLTLAPIRKWGVFCVAVVELLPTRSIFLLKRARLRGKAKLYPSSRSNSFIAKEPMAPKSNRKAEDQVKWEVVPTSLKPDNLSSTQLQAGQESLAHVWLESCALEAAQELHCLPQRYRLPKSSLLQNKARRVWTREEWYCFHNVQYVDLIYLAEEFCISF